MKAELRTGDEDRQQGSRRASGLHYARSCGQSSASEHSSFASGVLIADGLSTQAAPDPTQPTGAEASEVG